jgi:predicted HD phosphohydrolase
MPLQLVPIDELQLGSYVIAVTKQQGDVIVKDAGWVRSDEAIAMLRQRGVLEVQIDTNKQLPPPPPAPEIVEAAPPAVKKAPKILFEQEVNKAGLALQANVQIASIALPALVQHHQVDFVELNSVSAKLLDSTRRNHQALLFLQQVGAQDDELLQHSLSCACLMAAFCAELKLVEPEASLLTLAALLHDVGALQLKQLFPSQQVQDQDSAMYSVPLLQHQPECPPLLLQVIEEHCLSLAQQHSQGGKMLAIVNFYSKLTAASQKLNSAQAAAKLTQQAGKQLDLPLVGSFLKCVGLYYPGSAVRLKSGRIGLVVENHPVHADRPRVKLIYHSVHRHHLAAKLVDLNKQTDDPVEGCADLNQYQLKLQHYL